MSKSVAIRRPNPVLEARSQGAVARPVKSSLSPSFEDQTRRWNVRLFWLVGGISAALIILSAWFAVGWIGAEIDKARLEGKIEVQSEIIQRLDTTKDESVQTPLKASPELVWLGVGVILIIGSFAFNPALGVVVMLGVLAVAMDAYGLIEIAS